MKLDYNPQEWDNIKALCTPDVQEAGYVHYHSLVQLGYEDARQHLEHSHQQHPTEQMHKDLHTFMFRHVYRDAGELRTRQGLDGASPERISAELDSSHKLSRDQHDGIQTREERAEAIAVDNARIHVVRPFRDGNALLALLYTEVQTKNMLGQETPSVTAEQYRAQRDAAERGDVRGLATLLTGVNVEQQRERTASNLKLESVTVNKELAPGLYANFECKNGAQAYLVKHAALSSEATRSLAPKEVGFEFSLDFRAPGQADEPFAVEAKLTSNDRAQTKHLEHQPEQERRRGHGKDFER